MIQEEKNTVFCGVMLCSLVNVRRSFRDTYCLHLQGRRVCRTKGQRNGKQVRIFYMLGLIKLQRSARPLPERRSYTLGSSLENKRKRVQLI
jgi:hypothetical protein